MEFFSLQSTVDAEFFTEGSWHQHFLVMLNLRSKIFQNFFVYRVFWTVNFSELCPGTNFFGHTKFFGISSFREHSGL